MGKICTVFYSKSSTQIVKDITFLILFRKVSDTSMTDQFFQEKELVLRHGKNSNPFFFLEDLVKTISNTIIPLTK